MKKAELEAKILELEKKIIALEAKVPVITWCNCNHYCTLPHYPVYPTTPFWQVASGTAGSNGTVTFGNIS